MRHNGYITVNEIASVLGVSRKTILNDLKTVREELENKQLELYTKSHYGIKVVGDEIKIRAVISDLLNKNMDLHGSNATSAITNTLYLPLSIANAQALTAGTSMPYILNSYFLIMWKCPTRHFILAALLLWACKSKQLKAIGKVSVIPGFFGISEPMKYGIPMVFNPILLIPMVVTPMISLVIAYGATVIGFLPRIGLNIPWYMPFPFNGIMKYLGITKAGNSHLRTLLVEAAQTYSRGSAAVKSKALKSRQSGNDEQVIAYADKAKVRLSKKFRKLQARGVKYSVATAAIARELACFTWGLMTDHIN